MARITDEQNFQDFSRDGNHTVRVRKPRKSYSGIDIYAEISWSSFVADVDGAESYALAILEAVNAARAMNVEKANSAVRAAMEA